MSAAPTEGFMQNEVPPHTPLSLRDIPRVVEKSVNSVSAFGAKSSVHFLLPEGNPLGGLLLSPPNQVAQPSAALLRYGCGIPLAGTDAGLRRGPPIGEQMGCAKPPLQGEVGRPKPTRRGSSGDLSARRRSEILCGGTLCPPGIPLSGGTYGMRSLAPLKGELSAA